MGLGSEPIITEVRDLLGGRLVIPSIQRGYVWQKSQVPHLLDSLYRNYPVGALLIWKTTLEVPLKQAAILQDTQVQLQPAVLLDGQQRLTSLAKVIAPGRVVGGKLDVRFDLDEETFLNPSATQRNNARLLSVTELLSDTPQFAQILSRAGVSTDDPEYDYFYNRVRQVHGIREVLLPVTTVESDDYEKVAEIFARVNQGGRRLSKGDLVYSAIAARWPDGLETIEVFNEELDRRNFALDREAVLRLTGLLAGTGAHVIKLIGKTIRGDDLKAAWASTEIALKYAVDFLQGECGIPRAAVLSSPNVAVIPAYMLYLRKNRLTPDESEGLRRWIYTAMAFSYYSNQVEGKLDYDARLIRERRGIDLFDDLNRRASGARPAGTAIEPQELATKKATSSWFNLLYVAALKAGARDWLSNTALVAMPMASDSRIEYHHVFPRARVQKDYGRDLTDSIANLAFISGASNRTIGAKHAADYLPTIPTARLEEQGVPAETGLWDHGSFPDFLEERQRRLANVLNDMLGMRPYLVGAPHDADAELPVDDEVFDPESDPVLLPAIPRPNEPERTATYRGPGAERVRSVAAHVHEVFARKAPGTQLSIREIAREGSAQYAPNEISQGAIRQGLDRSTIPGIEIVPGSSNPTLARSISPMPTLPEDRHH